MKGIKLLFCLFVVAFFLLLFSSTSKFTVNKLESSFVFISDLSVVVVVVVVFFVCFPPIIPMILFYYLLALL